MTPRSTDTGRRAEDHVPSPGVLFQMIQNNAEKQDEDHKRIRTDLEHAVTTLSAAVARLSALESAHASTAERLTRIGSSPVDVTKIRFPLSMIVSIVGGFCILVIMGIGFSNKVDASNKSNEAAINALRTDVATWRLASDRENAQAAKISDERSLNIKETIKALDAQMRLQYAEFQTFRQEMARSAPKR